MKSYIYDQWFLYETVSAAFVTAWKVDERLAFKVSAERYKVVHESIVDLISN